MERKFDSLITYILENKTPFLKYFFLKQPSFRSFCYLPIFVVVFQSLKGIRRIAISSFTDHDTPVK